MQLLKEKSGSLRVVLHPAESALLSSILRDIRANYKEGDAGLHPDARDRWTGATALETSGFDSEDLEAWLEAREGFQSELLAHATHWAGELAEAAENDPLHGFTLDAAHADALIILANDHRMYLAAKFAVDESDMDGPWEDAADDNKRVALMTIHFLACLIEMLLAGIDD